MELERLRNDPTVAYMGDGVYATHDGYQIWLWVTDGIRITASIALDRNTFDRVKSYGVRLWGI